jgi:hypothetical protein
MNSHLAVSIAGNYLTLPSDFSIDIEEKNPMFNDTEEMFSYPAPVPLVGNMATLKNIKDINTDFRAVELEHLPARIFVDSFPFASGNIEVMPDEEIEDSTTLNITAARQSFADLIGDMKCSDVNIKDEIVIGEKIGNVHVDAVYTYTVNAKIGKSSSWTLTKRNNEISGDFEPQALGFSYPAQCEVVDDSKQVAVQDSVRSYPNNKSVVIPKVKVSYINTSAAYGETMQNGKPAYYANARICYKHYALGDDGKTSSSNVSKKDSKNIYEDIYPYWVLDANRPQSGLCFYVLYFLDCLFAQLGVSFDNSALLKIGDFKHLVFFSTRCKYTTRKATQYYSDTTKPYFSSLDEINEWLSSRGCGGKIEIENPEAKNVESFDYVNKKDPKMNAHYQVGTGSCKSITISASYDKTPAATADLYEMLASGANFPKESVSSVLSALENAFGIKFDYDYEKKKVTAYLYRDLFRKKDSESNHVFMGTVLSMNPITEKNLGFRMKYSAESSSEDQLENLKKGVKDYDTTFDYIDYPRKSTVYDKTYRDIFVNISPSDQTTYIDRTTGNAYRIKINKSAKTVSDFRPSLFEVGGYKGVELGDCSKENEDYIEEREISFLPVVFNDVNYYNELDAVAQSAKVEIDTESIVHNFNKNVSPVLAAYIDKDMEHEFVTQKIRNVIANFNVTIYATEVLNLVESYNPENTDDGNSPLQKDDQELSLAVMRGGGSDMGVQNYDYGYDGFGTGKWRTVSGSYTMSSDSIDQFGNDYDYNGILPGIGVEERFSLKIRAYKTPDWAVAEGISLCIPDEIDKDTMAITRKVRSRGLFDTFMLPYAHFFLNRKKFSIKVRASVAQLVDIRNHWLDKWSIGGKVGFINKISYSLSCDKGLGDAVIEFFSF